MPRQTDVPGQPAHNRVQVLLTDQDMDDLDHLRGTTPTSAYLRNVIRTHLLRADTTKADHEHLFVEQVASYTVMGKTTITYKCAHCPKTHVVEIPK